MLQEHFSFFAAMNTPNGFKSYFDKIFDPDKSEQIFILKGGPGTGKSSLMRKIANEASKRGYVVHRFYCSSDPVSLDGILIPELKLSVIDGTSPHTVDPQYPGAVETIVNLGIFWNRDKILSQRREILDLIRQKKQWYLRAFRFLKSAGEIEKETFKLSSGAINQEKMSKMIDRTFDRRIQKQAAGAEEIRIVSAFNHEGVTYLDSFMKNSDTIYIVEDVLHSGKLFLQEIYQKAKNSKTEVWLSPDPIFPEYPCAIYFPSIRLCVQIGKRNYASELKGKDYHYVNMNRFLDQNTIHENRQKIRFAKKCCQELYAGATEAFQQASQLHTQLEAIYVASMDFIALEAFSNSLIERIIPEKG